MSIRQYKLTTTQDLATLDKWSYVQVCAHVLTYRTCFLCSLGVYVLYTHLPKLYSCTEMW